MEGRDLTRGSVPRLLLVATLPVLASFILQSLYALADLYFVGFLGGAALAGVGISINTFFLVIALGQTIGSGALAFISQAYGRKDTARITAVFGQTFWLAIGLGAVLWAAGWFFAETYFDLFTADAEVRLEGLSYFRIYCATFLIQTFLIVCGACWRATGNFVLPTLLMGGNVLLNLALDPLLIFGWGPVPAFGVAGAAWATVIAQGLAMGVYFWLILLSPRNTLLRVRLPIRLSAGLVARQLRIGLPAGAQMLLATVALAMTYRAVRPFGADATAAVGVGFRLLQSAIFPAVAVGAACASMVGQNHGAGMGTRVRQTVGWAMALALLVMGVELTALLTAPDFWIGLFAAEPGVISIGARYLTINGFGHALVAYSLIATFSSQAMGRTLWPLLAVTSRVALYLALLLAVDAWYRHWLDGVFWAHLAAMILEAALMTWILAGLFRATVAVPLGAVSAPRQEADTTAGSAAP